MTTLERIKAIGGFADFGAIGSMPLGYFLDGQPAITAEYNEVQKLKAAKKLKVEGQIGNGVFPVYLTNQSLTGDLLKCK